MPILNMKGEINGQKIKVEKLVFRYQRCNIMYNYDDYYRIEENIIFHMKYNIIS